MITPHPILEHWTETDLQGVLANPEAVDGRMIDDCRQELERRAAMRERAQKAERELAAAKEKIEAHQEAERTRKLKEERRAEALAPNEAKPGQTRESIAGYAERLGQEAHRSGSRVHGFLLEALAMAVREGREAELLEILRPTQFARRWSYQHPRDMDIIVTFDECFPVKRARGVRVD